MTDLNLTDADKQFLEQALNHLDDPAQCPCVMCQISRGELPPPSKEAEALFSIICTRLLALVEILSHPNITKATRAKAVALSVVQCQLRAYQFGVEAAREEMKK